MQFGRRILVTGWRQKHHPFPSNNNEPLTIMNLTLTLRGGNGRSSHGWTECRHVHAHRQQHGDFPRSECRLRGKLESKPTRRLVYIYRSLFFFVWWFMNAVTLVHELSHSCTWTQTLLYMDTVTLVHEHSYSCKWTHMTDGPTPVSITRFLQYILTCKDHEDSTVFESTRLLQGKLSLKKRVVLTVVVVVEELSSSLWCWRRGHLANLHSFFFFFPLSTDMQYALSMIQPNS